MPSSAPNTTGSAAEQQPKPFSDDLVSTFLHAGSAVGNWQSLMNCAFAAVAFVRAIDAAWICVFFARRAELDVAAGDAAQLERQRLLNEGDDAQKKEGDDQAHQQQQPEHRFDKGWYVTIAISGIYSGLLQAFFSILSGFFAAFKNGVPDESLRFMIMLLSGHALCACVIDPLGYWVLVSSSTWAARHAAHTVPVVVGGMHAVVFIIAIKGSLPLELFSALLVVYFGTFFGLVLLSPKIAAVGPARQARYDMIGQEDAANRVRQNNDDVREQLHADAEANAAAHGNPDHGVFGVNPLVRAQDWVERTLWAKKLVDAVHSGVVPALVAAGLLVAVYRRARQGDDGNGRKPLIVKAQEYANATLGMSAKDFYSHPWVGVLELLSDNLDVGFTISAVTTFIFCVAAVARTFVFWVAVWLCDSAAELRVMEVALGISDDPASRRLFSIEHRMVAFLMRGTRVLTVVGIVLPVAAVGLFVLSDYVGCISDESIPFCTAKSHKLVFDILKYFSSVAIGLVTASSTFINALALGIVMLRGFLPGFERANPVAMAMFNWFICLMAPATSIFVLAALQLISENAVARALSVLAQVLPGAAFLATNSRLAFSAFTYVMPLLTAAYALSVSWLWETIWGYVQQNAMAVVWTVIGAMAHFMQTFVALSDLVTLLQPEAE